MQPSMNRFGIAVVSLALMSCACGSWSSAAPNPLRGDHYRAGTVTVAHKYGEITIDKEPQALSVGFADQLLLALGVTPIAIRQWYGEQPFDLAVGAGRVGRCQARRAASGTELQEIAACSPT